LNYYLYNNYFSLYGSRLYGGEMMGKGKGPGGRPSTTGKKSGGGRTNNPPKKK